MYLLPSKFNSACKLLLMMVDDEWEMAENCAFMLISFMYFFISIYLYIHSTLDKGWLLQDKHVSLCEFREKEEQEKNDFTKWVGY